MNQSELQPQSPYGAHDLRNYIITCNYSFWSTVKLVILWYCSCNNKSDTAFKIQKQTVRPILLWTQLQIMVQKYACIPSSPHYGTSTNSLWTIQFHIFTQQASVAVSNQCRKSFSSKKTVQGIRKINKLTTT